MPLLSFLSFVFISTFTPGPSNIMALLFANKYGIRKILTFCLGVGLGAFVTMLLSSYFSLLLKNYIPKIEFGMKILGTMYMLYLSKQILTSKSGDENGNKGNKISLISGFLFQLMNPKGLLFAIVVVSTFILPYYNSHLAFIGFSFFLALLGIISMLCWGLFGALFQKFLSSKYRGLFNAVMALLVLYSAISILV